jgi:RNA polymerase sigma-70 factor (ECF subfamily)
MGRISLTEVARWVRRGEPASSVDRGRFQGAGEPYPGHWREFPAAWPPVDPDNPAVAEVVAAGVEELPSTWRSVVVARDERGEEEGEVTAQYGVGGTQQRAILNKVRAGLWSRLADHFGTERR